MTNNEGKETHTDKENGMFQILSKAEFFSRLRGEMENGLEGLEIKKTLVSTEELQGDGIIFTKRSANGGVAYRCGLPLFGYREDGVEPNTDSKTAKEQPLAA